MSYFAVVNIYPAPSNQAAIVQVFETREEAESYIVSVYSATPLPLNYPTTLAFAGYFSVLELHTFATPVGAPELYDIPPSSAQGIEISYDSEAFTVTVSWGAPTSDGGSPVQGYYLTSNFPGSPSASVAEEVTSYVFELGSALPSGTYESNVYSFNNVGPTLDGAPGASFTVS